MRLPAGLIGWPLKLLYRLWCASLRYDVSGRDFIKAGAGTPLVFALWHDEIFPVPYLVRHLSLATIVSQHRDGEFVARMLHSLGIKTARGSSNRGGLQAIRETVELMRAEGRAAGIAIDGPTGPRHEPKIGAVLLACAADGVVVPVRVFAERAKVFNSWDKFRLPLPFSRVHVAFYPPYRPHCPDLDEETLRTALGELQTRMNPLPGSSLAGDAGQHGA
ncbi:MAG: lysophospholipid acyltransferase family protein [Planctomycetota bacterium]|jgi:lysophospholipid acyltransferase (LPLAT)-like uncharacterized protein|nr:lysophospholipid acyltransferase family protein [Planctomycetota bacterium]